MNPINRKEKYYQAILDGKSSDLPTPITREETYLKAIAENGGGGGESTGIWKPSVSNEGVISWEKSTSTVTPEEQNIKGPQGETGATGATGETGPAGPGLASGGVAGSLLFKSSNDDYATEWVDSGIATVEGNPATANTDSAGIGVQTVVDIEPIQAGSGDPSPENVREISGFDSIEIANTDTQAVAFSGLLKGTYGVIDLGDLSWTYSDEHSCFLATNIPNKSVRSISSAYERIVAWNNFIAATGNVYWSEARNIYVKDSRYTDPTAFETAVTGVHLIYELTTPTVSTITPEQFEALCEEFGVNCSITTIPLGETVYGGTLDVESGTLTVDRGFITFDGSNDENWSRLGEGSAAAYSMRIDVSGFTYTNDSALPPFRANYLKTIANRDTWGNYDAFISARAATQMISMGIRSITSVEDWRTYLASHPLQVCYELATPYTISLPPHQIKLLQGVNNLSTNAHSVTLTYRKGKVAMNSDLEGLADSINNMKTGSVVAVEQVVSEGTKIAEIIVDGETNEVFAPSGGGGGVTVDDDLSTTSTNPVQNKVITEELNKAYKTSDTAFTAIADADYIPIYDTSASKKKKSLWSNIKSLLKEYFDPLYGANYSTTEKVVGTWTDGKPLYQLTVSETFPTTTNGTWASTNISFNHNVSKIASLTGIFYPTDGIAPLPWIANSGYISKVMYDVVNKNIVLQTNNANVAGKTAYVTVQYTKTTD